MTIKKSIGGDRLGSGDKMKVELHNFERSNHDLGYLWRSTMAVGTLVPFMCEVGLTGDTWDIDLNADMRTIPTIGPLFGSMKLQLDVFMCPIRLYQGQLHNNAQDIGMKMASVKLPQLLLKTKPINESLNIPIDIQQINPSSIMSYLGLNGIGNSIGSSEIKKTKNAIPLIAYWDIYKNYYANQQEGIGAYICAKDEIENEDNYENIRVMNETGSTLWEGTENGGFNTETPLPLEKGYKMTIKTKPNKQVDLDALLVVSNQGEIVSLNDMWETITYYEADRQTWLYKAGDLRAEFYEFEFVGMLEETTNAWQTSEPNIETFDLKNLDEMRMDIQSKVKETSAFVIDENTYAPYGTTIAKDRDGWSKLRHPMQGLGLKTYQSDLFNNWMKTDWIDGDNGISAITSVDVSEGELKIDALMLAKKVYDMLTRVAVSGGTYYNWIEAVYGENPYRNAETPVYMGGLSKEIVFEEVISTAETSVNGDSPLGTLAGKGRLSDKHKGGQITIKVSEPCYIIGLVSITPRVDYSQGNRWDTRLKTMDDFHKPNLDGIGFQDLITEQMAWWDTMGETDENEVLKSAGKQPAWLNYMTNYNRVHGHFADASKEMYMTLNRRYTYERGKGIKDLTTYIDCSKFNYAFAVTDLQAQNFWLQINNSIEARRKISAKQIPNL